jgi:hypothetical protein
MNGNVYSSTALINIFSSAFLSIKTSLNLSKITLTTLLFTAFPMQACQELKK